MQLVYNKPPIILSIHVQTMKSPILSGTQFTNTLRTMKSPRYKINKMFVIEYISSIFEVPQL